MKKNLCVVMVMAIIFSVFPFETSAKASDLDNCWAKEEVKSWIDSGIINGYPDGTFRPDNNITRAEFMAIINNAFNFTEKVDIVYSDVPKDSWFAEIVQRAIAAGYISGYSDGTVRPDNIINRQEAATIIARLKKLKGNESETEIFTDSDLLPEWCKAYVGAVAEAKIMRGYPDGSFRGSDFISRAEAVVGLKQALEYKSETMKLYDKAGVYGPETGSETVEGNVYITTVGIELHNLIIKGNLIIDKSVKDGSITLRNVKVIGQTEVYGNGEIGISLIDSILNTINILDPNGKIRVTASGKSLVEKAVILSGVRLEESSLTGDGFKEVIIKDAVKGTTTLIGRFDLVRIRTEEVVLDLPQRTTIIVLEIETKSKITGTGIIQRAEIKASGVVFDYAPLKIIVAPGVATPIILYTVVSVYSGGSVVPQPVQQQLANPTANLAPGTYEGQQSVTLTSTTAGAEIWFTLDGTDPKTSAARLKYTAALNLSATTNIKAYAVKTGMLDSEIQSFSYIINMDSIAVAADKNALFPVFAAGDNGSSVTQNIYLPTAGVNGSVITWLSDIEAVISNTGAVTRGNTDQIVLLTATITRGTASAAKTFSLTVKAAEMTGNYSRSYPVMAYDPENNRYMMVYFKNDSNINEYNLCGRIIGTNGSYISDEFSIRTSADTGNSYNYRPGIAYDNTNKVFLVVWNEFAQFWDVYGQIMNTDGSKSGEPFAISENNDAKRQNAPFVAFDYVNNKFLVAYKNNIDANEQQDDIYGRFVSIVAGNPVVEKQFMIAGGMWYQDLHDISFNGSNKFMIPVSSYESNRIVAINSVTEAVYNEYVFGSTAFRPTLAFDNVNHRFLAAWISGNRIYGRFINLDGKSGGDTFQISDGVVNGYGNVSADYAAGYFYVAWQNEKNDGDIDIYVKKVDAASKALSPQIAIAAGAEDTLCPLVCGSSYGALIAWTIENQPKSIGSRYLTAQDSAANFILAPQAGNITLPVPIIVTLIADKPATVYYAVVQEDTMSCEIPAPTAEQVRVLGTPGEGKPDSYGVVPVLASGCQMLNGQNAEQIIISTIKGFNAMRTYTVYMVLQTGEGILSSVAGATFNTLADNNAPVFNQVGNITGVYMNKARSLILTEKTLDYDENYDLYIWVVKEANAPQSTPVATDVKANGNKYECLTSGIQHVITWTGLDPATAYKVYMLAQDYNGDNKGLYSAVLTDSETTLVDDPGPDKAGLSNGDCYIFEDEGSTRNKYLLIQLDQQLSAVNTDTLAGNIRIYDYVNEKTLTARGDSVVIIGGDKIRIMFAVPPSEDFAVYINAGALKGTQNVNKYEIGLNIDVPDITPAEFEIGYPKAYTAGIGDKSVSAEICLNEDAAVFWSLLPAGAAAPQYETSITDRTILNAINYGSISVDNWEPAVISITGLQSGISYDLWITAVDANNNFMAKQKITLTTTAN